MESLLMNNQAFICILCSSLICFLLNALSVLMKSSVWANLFFTKHYAQINIALFIA